MKENEKLELFVSDIGYNGEGVAKHEGLVIFIPFTNCSDSVNATIIKVTKNFAIARPDKLPLVTCPYFGNCGGCEIMHFPYSEQLKFKSKKVKDNLKKIANIDIKVNETTPSLNQFGYRNKITLTVRGNKIGFYNAFTNEIVDVSFCPIFCAPINDYLHIIKEYVEKYNVVNIRNIVFRKINTKMTIIFVLSTQSINNFDVLIRKLQTLDENISIFININKKKFGEVLSPNFKYLCGFKSIVTELMGLEVEISPNSFIQINSSMQETLYRYVLDLVNNCNKVVNLYSGAGLLSALISKKCKKVIGIEIIEAATQNANALAMKNYIKNMTNITGDAKLELPKIKELDMLILDPPRRGVDNEVLNTIRKTLPKEIIYISCDSATLSRDLNFLKLYYDISSVQPFDMFPQTCSVETVVKLVKKELE